MGETKKAGKKVRVKVLSISFGGLIIPVNVETDSTTILAIALQNEQTKKQVVVEIDLEKALKGQTKEGP